MKTTLQHYLSVFDGVTKQKVLPDIYFFCEMGLFTLHNCCVSWLLNSIKLKLDSQSRLTIPEFSGYHCRSRHLIPMYIGTPCILCIHLSLSLSIYFICISIYLFLYLIIRLSIIRKSLMIILSFIMNPTYYNLLKVYLEIYQWLKGDLFSDYLNIFCFYLLFILSSQSQINNNTDRKLDVVFSRFKGFELQDREKRRHILLLYAKYA